MAEAPRSVLARRFGCVTDDLIKLRGVVVVSAEGLGDGPGCRRGRTVEVVKSRGGSLVEHASRKAALGNLVRHADHIVAMTSDHLKPCSTEFPKPPPSPTPRRHRRPRPSADPVGSDLSTYHRTAHEIRRPPRTAPRRAGLLTKIEEQKQSCRVGRGEQGIRIALLVGLVSLGPPGSHRNGQPDRFAFMVVKIRLGILLVRSFAIDLRAAARGSFWLPEATIRCQHRQEGRGLVYTTLEDGTTYVHGGTLLTPGPARLLHGPRPSLLRIWSPALAAAAFTFVVAFVWLRRPIRISQARSRPTLLPFLSQ